MLLTTSAGFSVQERFGFRTTASADTTVTERQVHKTLTGLGFSTSFLESIDLFLIFQPLDMKTIEALFTVRLKDLDQRLRLRGIRFTWDAEVPGTLTACCDARLGASKVDAVMRDAVEQYLNQFAATGAAKGLRQIHLTIGQGATSPEITRADTRANVSLPLRRQ